MLISPFRIIAIPTNSVYTPAKTRTPGFRTPSLSARPLPAYCAQSLLGQRSKDIVFYRLHAKGNAPFSLPDWARILAGSRKWNYSIHIVPCFSLLHGCPPHRASCTIDGFQNPPWPLAILLNLKCLRQYGPLLRPPEFEEKELQPVASGRPASILVTEPF